MGNIRNLVAILGLFVVCILCVGCKSESTDIEKLNDIEFTIVKEEEIPAELKMRIDEKKQDPFKVTYYTKEKDFLYIVVGYGQQSSGGYSIAINELFLTKNAVYIDTNLIGPKKDDVVSQVLTYPYIVVKIEFTDLPVTFV